MSKPRALSAALSCLLSLSVVVAAAGCAKSVPGGGSSSSALGSTKACLVSGADGFGDKGVSQVAAQSLDTAVSQLGVQSDRAEAHSAADYPSAIQSMVSAGCTLIIGASPDQADALAAAARANADLHFGLIGATKPVSEANLKPVRFQSSQAGFLAGYLAAASSTSGTVGTFGSTNAPSVTLYMDGFSQGVIYFNQKKSHQVKLVGWAMGSQSGDFLGGSDPEHDADAARAKTESLISQGADVIMPVTGGATSGATSGAAQGVAAHAGTRLVGAGTDLCTSLPDSCANTLGSAVAGIDQMVVELIKQSGNFSNVTLVGTLANGGESLTGVGKGAPVPQAVIDDLAAVRQDIVSGSLKVTSPSSVS